MQPNEGFYRQWQLPSKDKQPQKEKSRSDQPTSALNINALLNQEPAPQSHSEAERPLHSPSSASEAAPPPIPPLQTNLQISQSPTSESPSTTFSFHQYDPTAPAEATVKRLPLRKRLTLETKVQQQQQIFQSMSTNISPVSVEQDAPVQSSVLRPVQPPAAAVAPQSGSETAMDGDTTETDEEKSSVELYKPVAVQEPIPEGTQSVIKMKPLKKAIAWSSTDSSTQFQNNFASMQSQFQLNDIPSTTSDIGIKREVPEESITPANKRPKPVSESPPAANAKGPASSDVLYCICRKPYDKPRFMIACDECDQWFHGECVGMNERDGGLIELYYCPACARATGKQTSWKLKCANPACAKPARTGKSKHRNTSEGESKYCSGDCGLLLARARIANCDKKRRAALEEPKSYRAQGPSYRSAADMDDRKLLVTLREQQTKLESALAQADRRSRFLRLAIRRQQDHKSAEAAATEEVKSLGMKTKRTDESGICGFDSRLLWEDDDQLQKLLEEQDDDIAIKALEEGDYHLCLNSRKCQRHSQWQKLKASEIELERSEDLQALMKLKKQRHQAKVRMKHRRENVTDIVNNGVIDHARSSVTTS